MSVVIKSYNHARYVEQTIRSVLAQTLEDFEIVFTDDASTDETPEIVTRFADRRIRFARLPYNHGIPRAMNATVARARGEYIAILNSDDFALPERLATQVAFLRANPAVAAVFDVPRQVGESGEPVEGFGRLFDVPFAHANPSRQEWLHYFFFHANCLCAPSAMIRRAAYFETGPYDPRLRFLHDLDKWVRLLESYEISVMKTGLTAFRIRAKRKNASAPGRMADLRRSFELCQVLKRYRDFQPDFLREIFSAELTEHHIDASGDVRRWLGQIARLGLLPAHRLFAMDALVPRVLRLGEIARR